MSESYENLNCQGYTSTIYKLPGTPPKICKSFNDDCTKHHFPTEHEVYKRFTANKPPSTILKFHGLHPSIPHGLILDFVENGDMWDYRWGEGDRTPKPRDDLLYRWASQAAEALSFAHGLGVLNSDIHPSNFFLDKDLNLKVGDWAGASIAGSQSYSSYRLRYRVHDSDGTDLVHKEGITVRSEVFALGSALYFMVVGREIWPELEEPRDDEEIKNRLGNGVWPKMEGMILGDVVRGCWEGKFTSMEEVGKAVEKERSGR